MVVENEVCPECGNTHIVKAGMAVRRGKPRQRIQCSSKECKRTFYPKEDKQ